MDDDFPLQIGVQKASQKLADPVWTFIGFAEYARVCGKSRI
jgi:hypothetical protein